MSEAGQPCGARFFDRVKQDMGRAVQVTTRPHTGPTLTVLDVTGAEPELARALTMLDRSRLRIHLEDADHTCYVFRWASGYENGSGVRIQGMLEASTGRELEGWTAKAPPTPRAAAPTPKAGPAGGGAVAPGYLGRPRRPW